MTSDEYQVRAYSTACYDNNIEYPFMALAEEVGEVSGKLAKYVRKNNVNVSYAIKVASNPVVPVEGKLRNDLIKELGDVLWNLAACCTELNVTLEQLQQDNINKLQGRKARGTIDGEGDNR